MLEAYNGGVLFGNSTGAKSREITTLGLDVEIEGDVEKAQTLARGKYLAQKKSPKTLTDVYGLMVAFEPMRATAVSVGRNEGMNFGNVAVELGTRGDGDHGRGSATSRKIKCWRCGGGHIKRNFLKHAEGK